MVGDLSYMHPELLQVIITIELTRILKKFLWYIQFLNILLLLLLQSFLAGEAASGALTSTLRLITKAAFENSQDGLRKGASKFNSLITLHHSLCLLYWLAYYSINVLIICNDTASAVLFFSISTFFVLLCVVLYGFVYPKLPIVKYYRSKAASEGSKTVSSDLAAAGIRSVLLLLFCFYSFQFSFSWKFLTFAILFIRLICVFSGNRRIKTVWAQRK